MIIRLILSLPLKRIRECAPRVTKITPLPDYISKRGPYVDNGVGAANQIVIMFEFEKRKLAEAWKYIFKHLDAFHDIPGFGFSAYLLEEGEGAEEFQVDLSERRQAVRGGENMES